MDKIKTVKIKNEDGSVSKESYYISANANCIDMTNGYNVQETIGNIDIENDGSIAEQLQKKSYYFNTIADMKKAKLKVGDIVITLGYYEINDGGGAEYKIIDGNYTDNKGIYHRLNNGLFAQLIIRNEVNVKQFGAYGDGVHDDTEAIQDAINNFNNVVFYDGIYKITDKILLKSNQTLQGAANHVIKYYGDGLDSLPILLIKGINNIEPIENVYVKNININCENQNYKGGKTLSDAKATSPYAYNKGLNGIHIVYGRNINVENCTINDLFGNGILIHYSSNVTIINNNLYDTGGSNALGNDSFGDGICFFSCLNCKAINNTIINKRVYLTHDVNYQNIDVYGKICGRSGLEFEYRLDKLWTENIDKKKYCVDYNLVNDMKMYGCIFENNYIYGYSKGIHLEEDVKSIIKNNTIIHNHIGILNTTGCEGTVIDGNYLNSDNVGPSPEGNYDMNYCAIFLADSDATNRVFGKFATNNKIFGDSKGIDLNGFEAIISNNEFKCTGYPIFTASQTNMERKLWSTKTSDF